MAPSSSSKSTSKPDSTTASTQAQAVKDACADLNPSMSSVSITKKTFPRSPSIIKESISPEKCSQLSPAKKKLPSPISADKRTWSVTMPARVYDDTLHQHQLRRIEARIDSFKSFMERAKEGEDGDLDS